MKEKILIVLLFSGFIAFSQSKESKQFAKTITTKQLYDRLAVLASDSLEGRETGERGAIKAARFIENQFKNMGLEPAVQENGPSYIQRYPLQKGTWQKVYLKKEDQIKENFDDFMYFSLAETKGEEIIELLYLDAGADLENHGLAGKFVIVNQAGGREGRQEKMASLQSKGVLGIFFLVSDTKEFEFSISRYKNYFSEPIVTTQFKNDELKIAYIGNSTLEWLYGKPQDKIKVGDFSKVILNADMLIENLVAENVLGVLKGSEYPDEYLILTSHYDHIGISADGQINNGADDDGSGTTAVMEIAEAFAQAARKGIKPKRSIVFMCVSGEEKGLLGSKFYTDNPIFPLASTVANLNIDMIGRVDEAHAANPDYIYLIGSDKLSQELHLLSEQVNSATVKLQLDYTYNDENDPNRFYYRSDHYNFAKNNIPIIFYFNGTHADYHKPTDTIEKINLVSLKKRTDLVFYTAWEIANRKERIKVD